MTVSGLKIPGWFVAIIGALIAIVSGSVSAGIAWGVTSADRKTFERDHAARLTLTENKLGEHLVWAATRNRDLQDGIDALVRLECLVRADTLVRLAGLPCDEVGIR